MKRLFQAKSKSHKAVLRAIAWGMVVHALMSMATPTWAADVTINTPTTESASYTVTGSLYITSGGSLGVTGSLIVTDNIDNSGLTEGISATGNLLVGGDVDNGLVRNFTVQGAGASSIVGELNNLGTFTFGNGSSASQLTLGSLNNQAGASLVFLSDATLSVSGSTLTNAGNVTFQASSMEIASGNTLTNSGIWTLTQGTFTNLGATTNESTGEILLSAGDFDNRNQMTNAGEIQITSGNYRNRDLTTNTGSIDIASGDFQNWNTLVNDGGITLTSGSFSNANSATITNTNAIILRSGDFTNYLNGLVTNSGSISVEDGNYYDSGGTLSGNGHLYASGSASFSSLSVLEGNPTILTPSLTIWGTVVPGTDGTVGQMTFNAQTTIYGSVLFDLVTPGSPGVGSDLIQIGNQRAVTLTQNAQFDFHLDNPPGTIGDTYEIISGSISLLGRPAVTDDVPTDDRRIVLRTNQDVDGFSAAGTAYYALVARDESYEQMAQDNNAPGYAVTFGRYLDQAFPQDDGTIGTANADLQWMRDTLDLMPNESDVVQALGQMSGQIYAPLTAVAMQRQFFAYSQIAGHLREDIFRPGGIEQLELCGGRYASLTERLPLISDWVVRGWASVYGFGGAIVNDSDALGGTYGGGGVQVGYGYQINERFGLGFFYDFGSFSLKNDLDDSANAYAHSFGGYLTCHRDNDYFIAAGGGGFAGYDATRYMNLMNPENEISRTAQGAPLGYQAAFYAEYGRNIPWAYGFLRPYVGALFMNVLQDAFTETGADSLNLQFEQSSANSFRTLLGAQVDVRSPERPRLVWSFQSVWMHECSNEASPQLTAGFAATPDTSFLLARPTVGTDWYVLGVGVRGSFLCNHIRPYAKYDLLINSQQSYHAGFAGIEYVW